MWGRAPTGAVIAAAISLAVPVAAPAATYQIGTFKLG
jgi:hypothetical protein